MKRGNALLALALSLSAAGCATDSAEERLNEKLTMEAGPTDRAGLKSEYEHLVQVTPNLTPGQRAKLDSIWKDAEPEAEQLRVRSLELRAVLIRNVLGRETSHDEIEAIQEDIRKVERQRLSLLFKAVREVNMTLGRWPSREAREDEVFYEQMMMQMNPYFYY